MWKQEDQTALTILWNRWCRTANVGASIGCTGPPVDSTTFQNFCGEECKAYRKMHGISCRCQHNAKHTGYVYYLLMHLRSVPNSRDASQTHASDHDDAATAEMWASPRCCCRRHLRDEPKHRRRRTGMVALGFGPTPLHHVLRPSTDEGALTAWGSTQGSDHIRSLPAHIGS